MTANSKAGFSLLGAVLLLAIGMLVLYPFAKSWPVFRRWLAPQDTGAPSSTVWINKRSGFYYCAGSEVYGKIMPGELMPQEQALQQGYRPVEQPCR
jgi:hypothetical protein